MAELNGFLLGLEHVSFNSAIAVVSDYLGVAAWISGNWGMKDEEVKLKIKKAHNLINIKNLTIDRMIHHAGHQKDKSHFTRFNNMADVLASNK